jgi:putative FmdB family regulatory protein
MPSYDYSCKLCGSIFTINKSMNDTTEPNCPACQSPDVKKLWGGIQFKGCGGSSGSSGGGGCGGCGGGSCGSCH